MRLASDVGQIVLSGDTNRCSVIAGTRIPTADIRFFLDIGYAKDEILKEYPTLTIADVEAAIAYEANPMNAAATVLDKAAVAPTPKRKTLSSALQEWRKGVVKPD